MDAAFLRQRLHPVVRSGWCDAAPRGHSRDFLSLQAGLIDDSHDLIIDGSLFEDPQLFDDSVVGAPVFCRHRVEDLAAADRDHR